MTEIPLKTGLDGGPENSIIQQRGRWLVSDEKIGERLKRFRKRAGITQETAAHAIHAGRTTIIALEQGKRRLHPDELVTLARLYKIEETDIAADGELLDDAPVGELFYIWNKERYCWGNDAVWWGKNHSGYTSNLDNAGLYTKEEAEKLTFSRHEDFPIPRSLVYAITHRSVNIHLLLMNLKEAADE